MAESIRQFHERHGGDALLVDDMFIFSDGARRENHRYGQLFEPPKDPYELAGIKLTYQREVFSQLKEEFNDLRSQIRSIGRLYRSHNMGSPDRTHLERLKAAKEAVAKQRKVVERCKRTLDRATPPDVKNRAVHVIQRRQENDEFFDLLSNIRI